MFDGVIIHWYKPVHPNEYITRLLGGQRAGLSFEIIGVRVHLLPFRARPTLLCLSEDTLKSHWSLLYRVYSWCLKDERSLKSESKNLS